MTFTDMAWTAIAAVSSALAQWLLIPLARRRGLLDMPGGRHDHGQPTPLVGGIGIFAGVLAVGLLRGELTLPFCAYLAAAALVVLVGVIDDLRDLSWRLRLVAQASAGLILAAGGVYAQGAGSVLDFGVWAIPFSVFASVGIINAVNMIDGCDGLSGSLVLIALVYFALLATDAGAPALGAELLLVAAATAGFLLFNLRRPGLASARVFLGNSGSALLGITVAWGAFSLAQVPGNASAGILAPWLVAIPLIDCVVVMLRRLRAGRSPFFADRTHLHHLLRDAGHAPQRIVALCAAASLSAGTAAWLWLRQGGGELPLVLVFLGLILLHFVWSGQRERAVAQLRRLAPKRHAAPRDEGYDLGSERVSARRR
jgi:UDP-GlcNAc:undecaprenyl-phosphate/decaprenyl-phosphate GlcNAc-1-phosphate transferase